MAASTRARSTKPRTTRTVPAAIDADESVPRLSTKDVTPDDPSDLQVLFYIDDTPYYVSTAERAELALRYLHMARAEGQEFALAWMLEEVVGADAYKALMNFDKLPGDALGKIVNRIQHLILGGMEAPKGSQRRGSRN